MNEQIFPNKTFYRVIYKDTYRSEISEIDYVGSNINGDLFIEKHLANGTVLTTPLKEGE